MRIFLAVLLVWSVSIAALASDVSPEVQALANSHTSTLTLRGSFRWFTGLIDGTGDTRERLGEFAVERGQNGGRAKYNLRSQSPQGDDIQRWCSNGTTAWTVEQAVAEEPPQVKEIKTGGHDFDVERIVSCVLLDLPKLTADFAIQLNHQGDEQRLVFTPLAAPLKEDLASITVLLNGNDPREVIVDDTKGTRIRLVIVQLSKNDVLNQLLFTAVPK